MRLDITEKGQRDAPLGRKGGDASGHETGEGTAGFGRKLNVAFESEFTESDRRVRAYTWGNYNVVVLLSYVYIVHRR